MSDTKISEAVELLPCPFCGGADIDETHVTTFSIDSSYDVFGCLSCGANFEDGTPADWNQRAAPAHLQGEAVPAVRQDALDAIAAFREDYRLYIPKFHAQNRKRMKLILSDLDKAISTLGAPVEDVKVNGLSSTTALTERFRILSSKARLFKRDDLVVSLGNAQQAVVEAASFHPQPAALNEVSGDSGELGGPFEMRICEIAHVCLKPNMAYVFTVDPNCEKCRQAASNSTALAATGKQQVGARDCGDANPPTPWDLVKDRSINWEAATEKQQVGEVQGDALHDAQLLLAKHLEKESPSGAQKLRLASAMDLASSPTIMAALTAIAEISAARQPGAQP